MINIKKIDILLLSILILILIVFFKTGLGSNNLVIKDINMVEVKEGDTLWEIATEINDNSFNNHRLILVIKEMNELNTVIIRPGQTLKVPVIEKNNNKLEVKR